MASKLGTVFVELSLDDKVYKQKLSELKPNVEATAKGLETSWKALGVKTNQYFDDSRRAAENAYALIQKSGKYAADELIRAEQAKNAKIKQINEQQYGHQTSMIEGMKSNWMAASAAIVAAWYTASRVISRVTDIVMQGVNAIDKYNLAAIQTAAIMTGMMKEDKRSLADRYKESYQYAKLLNNALEQVDKNVMLNFQDLQSITVEMMKQGVIMDINSKEEIKAFTQISNALAVISAGYPNKEIQLRQEIRALLSGQVRATDQLAQMMDAQLNGKLKEQIELHKKSGDLIIWIGGQLKGFAAAQDDINASWETARSTLETTYNQVLREGFQSAFRDIVAGTQQLSAWVVEHKEEIGALVNGAWNVLKFTVLALVKPLYIIESIVEKISSLSRDIAGAWREIKSTASADIWSGQGMQQYLEAGSGVVNNNPPPGTVKKPTLNVGGGLSDEEKKRIEHAKTVGEQLIKETQKVTLSEIEYINWMAEEYRKMGVDKTIVAKWAGSEIEKINQKEADKILKIQQDAQEAIGKHQASATKEYEKLLTDEAEFGMTENERQVNAIIKQEQGKLWAINIMLQEGTISWDQYEKARIGITTNASKAILDNKTEEANRIASINSKLIDGIIGMETTAFNLKMEQIEAEKNKYIKDGGDVVYAAKWAANEQIKALIKLGRTGDSISGGMSAAFKQFYLDQITLGQAGYDMTMGFYSSTSSMFGSMLYDMKDGMSSFSDYWGAFTDSLWKIFAEMVAKMVTQWLFAMDTMAASSGGLFGGGGFSFTSLIPGYGMFSSLSSLFSGGAAVGGAAMGAEAFSAEAMASMVWLHGGGKVGEAGGPPRPVSPEVFINAPRAHTGLAANERPVIAKIDEWVFRDKDIKNLIKMAGNSGDTYNITVKGSIVTVKSLARELVPEIEKAKREGVH